MSVIQDSSFKKKTNTIMYENLWVEPHTDYVTVDLPTVPPRPGGGEKTYFKTADTFTKIVKCLLKV